MYVVHSIGFQTFFVQAYKIIVDSWKSNMLLLYILWDDWPIFMISGFVAFINNEFYIRGAFNDFLDRHLNLL